MGLPIPANREDGATDTPAGTSVLGSDPKWPTSGLPTNRELSGQLISRTGLNG